MEDKRKFTQTMVAMGELHDKELSPVLVNMYWTALKEFADDDVSKAFDVAMMNLKWFPKPSELREIITGNSSEQAHSAWSGVIKAIECGAGHRLIESAKLAPEIEALVIEMGGWRRLAGMSYRDLDFLKKDFVELYRAKSSRGAITALQNNVRSIRHAT
jgi:hypothetical protein